MFQITLKFLEAVELNNSKEWLHTYRDLYQQEKTRFYNIVDQLLTFFQQRNPHLEDLKPSDCIYRFNKDLRFSRDPKPYKDHFGACFAKGGKKSRHPCFYFHLQPRNKSMLATGVYYPSQKDENKIRKYLIKHFDEWRRITHTRKFNTYFSYIPADHQYKTAHKLKTLFKEDPKLSTQISPLLFEEGFEEIFHTSSLLKIPTTEMIQTLVYNKDWIFSHPLSDEEVSSPQLVEEIMNAYDLALPLLLFFEEAYNLES